jgi:hypothetical protein
MLDLLEEIEGWDDDPPLDAKESRPTTPKAGAEWHGDQV